MVGEMKRFYVHEASPFPSMSLTHWGRVTHICVGNLTIIGPGNGLSPVRRQAIIWTNAGILLIGPWGTNFSEILIGIQTLSFKKMHLKMPSAKWRPCCLGLNVLTLESITILLVLVHFSRDKRVVMKQVIFLILETPLIWIYRPKGGTLIPI